MVNLIFHLRGTTATNAQQKCTPGPLEEPPEAEMDTILRQQYRAMQLEYVKMEKQICGGKEPVGSRRIGHHIISALNQMREELETLNKVEEEKKRRNIQNLEQLAFEFQDFTLLYECLSKRINVTERILDKYHGYVNRIKAFLSGFPSLNLSVHDRDKGERKIDTLECRLLTESRQRNVHVAAAKTLRYEINDLLGHRKDFYDSYTKFKKNIVKLKRKTNLLVVEANRAYDTYDTSYSDESILLQRDRDECFRFRQAVKENVLLLRKHHVLSTFISSKIKPREEHEADEQSGRRAEKYLISTRHIQHEVKAHQRVFGIVMKLTNSADLDMLIRLYNMEQNAQQDRLKQVIRLNDEIGGLKSSISSFWDLIKKLSEEHRRKKNQRRNQKLTLSEQLNRLKIQVGVLSDKCNIQDKQLERSLKTVQKIALAAGCVPKEEAHEKNATFAIDLTAACHVISVRSLMRTLENRIHYLLSKLDSYSRTLTVVPSLASKYKFKTSQSDYAKTSHGFIMPQVILPASMQDEEDEPQAWTTRVYKFLELQKLCFALLTASKPYHQYKQEISPPSTLSIAASQLNLSAQTSYPAHSSSKAVSVKPK